MKNYCAMALLFCLPMGQPLFGQTPEIGIRGPGTYQEPAPVTAADADAILLEFVPSEVRPVRERQIAAARSQGVELTFRDTGTISVTAIRGVPLAFSGISIESDEQIASLMETLYPLFGFGHGEQLVLSGPSGNGYIFSETINGIPVDSTVINITLGSDRTVSAIRGAAVINRNFGADHPLDADEAVKVVERHLEQHQLSSQSRNRAEDVVHLVYRHWDEDRVLVPWWYVEKAGHSGYFVDPNGAVASAVMVTP